MSTSRKDLRLVVDTYKFYYEKVSKVNNFVFKMTDTRAVMITNFIKDFKELNKTNILQEVALKRFFDFQFNHWYRRDGKFGKGISIQIEWIIGKQAVERWKNVNKKHIDFVVRKNLKADNDFKDKNIKKENWDNILINPQLYEESLKARNLNKNFGMESCMLVTNMYNHKSSNCKVCKFASECKNMLEVLYPKIYKIRGYGKV